MGHSFKSLSRLTTAIAHLATIDYCLRLSKDFFSYGYGLTIARLPTSLTIWLVFL